MDPLGNERKESAVQKTVMSCEVCSPPFLGGVLFYLCSPRAGPQDACRVQVLNRTHAPLLLIKHKLKLSQ